jgi:RNA polymerase sigma-70 factor (ECF subfamily)
MPGKSSRELLIFPVEHAQQEEQLVLAIASGDPEAEQIFVLQYLPKVRAMLLARTRDPEVAADLQQDVMIEAICALRRGQLRDAAKLSAFVRGIAGNLLKRHFQNASRQPVSLEYPDDLPDFAAATDTIAEQQQQDLIRHGISSLEPVDRSILELTLVEGLKPGAIAERLRLSSGAVRQRKVRAIRKIIDFVSKSVTKQIHSPL